MQAPAWLAEAARVAAMTVAGAILASLLQVVAVSIVTPPYTLRMVDQAWERGAWPARRVRSLERLGENGARAFVTAEDGKFFLHGGFDNQAICNAVRDAMHGKRLRGASTISQQVAKNVFLLNQRSLARKGLEVWYTFWLEALVSKQRILELYLNVAETGPGTFGLEAGAQHHFGKSAAKLTRTEAGRMAGILPNPQRSINGKAAWSRATWIAAHPAPFPGDRLYDMMKKQGTPGGDSLVSCFF